MADISTSYIPTPSYCEAHITRGTTPTFSIEVDCDLTGWDTYMTFAQRQKRLTRRDVSITPTDEGCVVEAELTQEETLSFKEGAAQLQIRAEKDGTAVASTKFDFAVRDVLLNGKIPQEAEDA